MAKAKRKRKRSKSGKGSTYEREMCRTLSLWWSDQERDDLFWRSSNSGGRATSRSRRGKATYGQHGDVAAVDPIGAPLTNAFTIEIKRGYSRYSIFDVIDKPSTSAMQHYEEWIDQAAGTSNRAGTWSWLLITRADRREALVTLPTSAYDELRILGAWQDLPMPSLRLRFVPYSHVTRFYLTILRLDAFLEGLRPEMVQQFSQGG